MADGLFLKVKTECLHLLIGVDYVVSLMTERVLSQVVGTQKQIDNAHFTNPWVQLKKTMSAIFCEIATNLAMIIENKTRG